ncbi:hypothetical protein [Variovorax soli]|uniref:O-antigen/teichoic acid export membrane protein n=1 Tax=Variovorax soli TaxID=376815 RepID=A0ABU1N8F8_9BURK|nr:hypothetical protein [Variovorax soli]MDR6534729.1 O-antigen/teichoic acid export membrane protein [Variovorax soli]
MPLPLTLSSQRARQFWYAPLLVLSMGLMMLRMLAMAQVLDVHAFADFSGGILISTTFSMIGCLGLQAMLQREWPVNLVRHQELRGIVRAAQCNVVALGCCFVGMVGAAAGLSLAGTTPALLGVGLLHGFSHQIFLVSTAESRSRGEALRFASQNLQRAVIALALSVLAALWFGSALLALATDALITIALSQAFFRSVLGRSRLGVSAIYLLAVRRLRRVPWTSALTMMFTMMLAFGLFNADRWIASDRLGAIGFAHYSFAWIVLSVAQSAQAVINASVYPLLARRFAQYGGAVAFDVCVRISISVLAIGVVVLVPLYLVLDYGIYRWYPRYGDAQTLIPIFLVIAVLRASDFWSSFLLISGRETQLLKINLCAMVISLIVWASFVRPWTPATTTLQQMGWLAGLLTLSAYLAAAGVSWRVRHG